MIMMMTGILALAKEDDYKEIVKHTEVFVLTHGVYHCTITLPHPHSLQLKHL